MRLTVEDVRRDVAQLLEVAPESLRDEDDLIALGLDSLRLMRLAGGWRRSGARVTFADLATVPTVAAWIALLDGPTEQPPTAPQSEAGAGPGSEPAPEPRTEPGAGPTTEPTCDDRPFPLALMQHAYWIGRSEGQTLGGVAAHLYTEFDTAPGDAVDPARLAVAARALIARHPMLRVRVTDDGRQEILPTAPGEVLRVLDLRDADPDTLADRLDRIRDECSHQMLDIESGRVLDLRVTLLPDDRSRLHLDVDMVAADALSYRVLLADLARLYAHPRHAPAELGYDYRSYLAARPPLRRAAAERAAAYWHERLHSLPGAPELPLRSPRPADLTRVTRRHLWLNPEERGHWSARAHAHGITPAMAFATAFAGVLAGWSGTPRFLLNVPLFDREDLHPDVPRLVGDFTGSVLLDVDMSEQRSFLDHARALQTRMHRDAAHADHSGLHVLRDLARARGEQVLAPIVYTSALGLGELFDAEVRGLFGEPTWIVSQGPQVLLDAQITEVRGGLLVNWDVREDAFPDRVADAMFAAYRELLTRLGSARADWREPIGELLPAAQRAVLDRVNATDAPRSHRALHDGFFAHAATRPHAPALVWGPSDTDGGTVSYGELAERALRVAAALRTRGIGPGGTVAITLPKGPDQIVAALGVLATGAAYVPIGVEQPPARRERIHRTARAHLVLDADGTTGGSPLAPALALAEALAHPAEGPVPVVVDEEGIAYVLFTSGSTGEPKGVEVPHRAAMNTIDDLVDRFALGREDRALGLSALDFDLSVFDVFGLLSVGGAVVLPADEDRREAGRWVDLVRERHVTVVNCVPALLDMLLTAGAAAGPAALGAGLRVVLLGGDWVTVDLPGRLHAQAPHCRFVALGGTTETAIHSTVYEVPAGTELPPHWRAIPYGTPLRNVRCRVVDAIGRDTPDHVPGELWIGGDGVAAGYRGDPERTADRFREVAGRRWYRTGDLARRLPDGTLEFLGRADHQVKLRGFRIEPGEIEAALAGVGGVRRAVAGVHGGALVAAVAAEPDVSIDRLRDAAEASLPAHMIPEHIVLVDELPLTANGKVDRRALAPVWARRPAGPPPEPPRTDLERLIASTWREALPTGTRRLGRDDDFFALGGDSILATTIVGRLRESLGPDTATVRQLFTSRTIASLATHLRTHEQTPGRLEHIARIHIQVAALSDEAVAAALDAPHDPPPA
ncbi:non-ribosomal peptide synthetase [Embleya scabrispora]|uniref:non-ribosomal peptide synthetase n=1 Tax=Embleya scabrispora TaxID=159449 RepID=UPI000362AED6|nr:non-ribosomal peptide synthetase [Embleya scabrispora]MYS86077.1 non-ribosomal peptide synthetase [Streptomyces sp. SID5474]